MGIRLVAPTDSGADILEGCRNRDPEAQRGGFDGHAAAWAGWARGRGVAAIRERELDGRAGRL